MTTALMRRYTRDQLAARPTVGTRHLGQVGGDYRWCDLKHDFGVQVVIFTLEDLGLTDQFGGRYFRVATVHQTRPSSRVAPIRDVSDLATRAPAVGDLIRVREDASGIDVRSLTGRDTVEFSGLTEDTI